VSSGSGKDKLIINFNDTSIFLSEDGQSMKPSFKLEFEIPRQNANSAAAVDKKQMISSSQAVARATIVL
jgi:hypothetical protein